MEWIADGHGARDHQFESRLGVSYTCFCSSLSLYPKFTPLFRGVQQAANLRSSSTRLPFGLLTDRLVTDSQVVGYYCYCYCYYIETIKPHAIRMRMRIVLVVTRCLRLFRNNQSCSKRMVVVGGGVGVCVRIGVSIIGRPLSMLSNKNKFIFYFLIKLLNRADRKRIQSTDNGPTVSFCCSMKLNKRRPTVDW